jgi:hypothetical protein
MSTGGTAAVPVRQRSRSGGGAARRCRPAGVRRSIVHGGRRGRSCTVARGPARSAPPARPPPGARLAASVQGRWCGLTVRAP